MKSQISSKNSTQEIEELQIPNRKKILSKTRPKITITEIAERLGVSHTYISLILHGKRKLSSKNKFHRQIQKTLNNI